MTGVLAGLRGRFSRDRPLIAFVHVPKTAGSALNEELRAWQPSGFDHVEHWIADRSVSVSRLQTAPWVSAHLPLPEFRAALELATKRPLRFVTLVRDPTAQVRSHYNWLIEIFDRGEEFYESHTDLAKEISARLRSTNNNDPARVVEQLELASGLFLNCQSAFVLGRTGGRETFERLDDYHAVAPDDRIGALVDQLSGRVASGSRVNSSSYHFDPRVFETPTVQAFLAERNALDIELYERVRATSSES